MDYFFDISAWRELGETIANYKKKGGTNVDVSADNVHPTPETLDRLQRVGAKVFRNDEDGDVISTI